MESRFSNYFVISTLLLHAYLISYVSQKNAPVPDELAHLTAGISIWEQGQFNIYKVNPPLVRLIASAPVALNQPEADQTSFSNPHSDFGIRPEWSLSLGFIRKNIRSSQKYFAWARWICIPFSLIGGFFCYRWASELYCKTAGALSLILWCFSPNVIAWSATICPDSPAAGLGVAGNYYFWRWLVKPVYRNALLAGVCLGLIELTKMTWLILFAVWPLIWLIWALHDRSNITWRIVHQQILQLCLILFMGVYIINLGYAFEGSFTKLNEFTFFSRTFAGVHSIVDGGPGGNLFSDCRIGDIPVPLPRNYLEGIDLQKVDFETGLPSYLLGEWRNHGWWYYYIICGLLKIPLGTWILIILAVGVRMSYKNESFQENSSVDWPNEIALLLPAVVLFCFVSSQTGFSRHFRYVLPAFPLLFIWISNLAISVWQHPKTIGVLVVSGVVWMIISSVSIYPYSMSYFNEITGGPKNGHRYVLDSNLDWGQDIYYFKKWLEDHPESKPIKVLFRNSYSADLLEMDHFDTPLQGPKTPSKMINSQMDSRQLGPIPGWYAVSIQRIHDPDNTYLYFLEFEPFALVGYTIYIYHITLDEANRVRQKMGLMPL